MNAFLSNEFIFSPRYHVWRHVIYWIIDMLIWATFWTLTIHTFWHNLFKMAVWLPVFLLYSYPLIYWVVPRILLKGKFISFVVIILFWGILGWYINKFYRAYIFIPCNWSCISPTW